jgi:hypothetical protein
MATEHFTDDELRCRCCGSLPTPLFQRLLQELRYAYGKPIVVNSCKRCAVHDASLNGSGAHLIGAVDVKAHGKEAYWLVACAIQLGWTGIGLRQHGPIETRFVHLDRRQHVGSELTPWIWTYKEK